MQQQSVNVVVPERYRGVLHRARAIARKLGLSDDKVQFSYLRIGTLASASKTEYEFNVRKDVGNSLAHDRKLDQNDAFVIADLGMFLLREDPAKPGSGKLETYPNNSAFAVAGEVAITDLESFYNGYYRLKVGDRVFAEAIPTKKMRVARTTQQSSATTFSENLPEDGFYGQVPEIILDGSGKNELTLVVPGYSGKLVQETTATTRIHIVTFAIGFQIIGGGKVSNLKD